MVKKKLFYSLFSRREVLLLGIIILIALFVRVYNLPYVVNYDFDQEYASMFANSVVNVYPIQMIGQGLSVQGLFMGPWYFYYLVPFFLVSGMHPIGGYIGSIVVGLIITATYFYTGKLFFDARTGFVLAIFRALLFNAMIADWFMAPSYSSELILLLMIISLYKFWHGSKKAIMPIAFLSGLLTSVHPILFPLCLSILVVLIIKRKFISIKLLGISVILFLIPLSPLIRFEMLRNFLEVKQLFALSHTNRAEVKNLTTFIEYVRLIFYFPYNYLRLPDNGILRIVFSIVGLSLLGYTSVKKIGFWKDNFHIIMLGSTLLFFLMYYFFLPIHASDYYFLGANLLLFMYLLMTFLLFIKNKKVYVLLIIAGCAILFFNIEAMINHVRFPLITLGNKDAVVKAIVTKEMNQEYGVGYEVGAGWQYGFGELFRYYDKAYKIKPEKVAKKNIYTISSTIQKNKGTLLITSGILNVYVRQEN